MDNTLIIDNALTGEECNALIEEGISIPLNNYLNEYVGYESHTYNYPIISPHIRSILDNLSQKLVSQYIEKFPAIKMTSTPWILHPYTFKHFPPGYSFAGWHSEHDISNPFRVLSILIYLSDHNCGTEFYNGEVVKSIKGRALVFPGSWTHTHRGQVCPDKKSRFILSAYGNLQQRV